MASTPVMIRDARGRVICQRCTVAESPRLRMRGLLGRRDLPAGEGLLLRPAPSIHTWFMRFPIDAVFLDREMRVLDVVSGLRPWRMAARRKSRAVLEVASGQASRHGLRRGDTLELLEPAGDRAD
jgi:uncharacterized protein